MTESEWLSCQDPEKMLEFLRGRATDRKLRLFAAACCRRVWHLLSEGGSRNAVEAAERYAEGLASDAELAAAAEAAAAELEAGRAASETNRDDMAAFAVGTARAAAMDTAYNEGRRYTIGRYRNYHIQGGAFAAAGLAAGRSLSAVKLSKLGEAAALAEAAERDAQTHLLRCIIGNPFKPLSISPAVLAWHNGTVAKLATVIYDDRRWEDMPLLGDALEEVSCSDRDVLAHCRGPGPHARGCFVLDAILGRS
jgi:hypothetical protein